MTIYLSGPMTGYPQFNCHNFESVATFLKELGYKVINPHCDLPDPTTT